VVAIDDHPRRQAGVVERFEMIEIGERLASRNVILVRGRKRFAPHSEGVERRFLAAPRDQRLPEIVVPGASGGGDASFERVEIDVSGLVGVDAKHVVQPREH
jgi:hypothetical protein